MEAWSGEGAAFARYSTAHGPLFLKYLPAGWQDRRAYRRVAREEAYLRRFAPLSPVPHAPLLHAALDPARGHGHLLLRDLTDETTGWGAFATDAEREEALRQIVRLLAQHHAFWFGHPQLSGDWSWDRERAIRRALRSSTPPNAPAAARDAAGQAARLLPELLGQTLGVTLAHGDLHSGQVLWPRRGGEPVLIDYGQAHAAPLGEDLAHLLHVRLDPPERARLAPELRETYREALAGYGIVLSRTQLADEERLGLVLNVLTTARQARREGGSGVQSALERVVEAWHTWDAGQGVSPRNAQ
ncbi:Putative homoserine kinase type II (protein kinase fold) [Deinococcus hopiensis KR-140]|uniref:Putative homoserine kinase type II (Protein kinase fold) n=1 Tax=Deinococcus hopiensis KR-140 TaxID=695939 RepID=A0A1W1VM11_9DEIO|nr:Putative homoserine kinase type II (protein kinase fold) [Deinococcus hopiensis KR-140]